MMASHDRVFDRYPCEGLKRLTVDDSHTRNFERIKQQPT
jgi:hypothetical protein